MSNSVFDGLAVGDIVEHRRTMRVASVNDREVFLKDVVGDYSFYVFADTPSSSLQISMVKKAAKPHPKLGDIITGKQVKETHWKRGTVLLKRGFTFLLLASGEWQTAGGAGIDWPDDGEDYIIKFGSLQDAAEFTVLHAPR